MKVESQINNSKIIEVKNLEIQYIVDKEIVQAVNNISFSISEGETLGLVGETGAGKTTTSLAMIGLLPIPPAKIINGEIIYNGENLLHKSEKQMQKIRGNDITMIFQDPMTSLNPLIPIGNQIIEVILLHEQVSKNEAANKAKKMLETVGIPANRYDDYPHQLSGGMKQRVMIAIALACRPQLLIADEPTTALDVTIQAQVLRLMNDLKTDFDTAVLLITHDLGVVAETCDSVAIMYAGEIVEKGSLKQIFENMQHPYTKGVFEAIPDLDVSSEYLVALDGLMPDPNNLPNGCNFHPRCKFCMDVCKIENPLITELSQGHFVKCHLYSGKV